MAIARHFSGGLARLYGVAKQAVLRDPVVVLFERSSESLELPVRDGAGRR